MTQVLLTVVNTNDDPIAGANVMVFSTDYITPLAGGVTDVLGKVLLEVPEGPCLVLASKPHVLFSYTPITVPAPEDPPAPDEDPPPYEVEITGIPVVVVPPTPTAQCLVHGQILDPFGVPAFGSTVILDVLVPSSRNAFSPSGGTGVSSALGLASRSRLIATTGRDGTWSVSLVPGTKVRAFVPDSNWWKSFTVPNLAQANIADVPEELNVEGVWAATDVPISR